MAEFTARGGETLCFLAVEFGYADCRPLRNANPHLQNRETLETGDRVTIPEVTRGSQSGQTETLHRFRRQLTDLPTIQFIFEEGKGYGQNLPQGGGGGSGTAGGGASGAASRNQPQLDRRLGALNINNYVVDRTGDGFTPNTFPQPDFFNFDAEASRDPDHFKVQVHAPRLPQSQTQVRLTLFAMRPVYFKGQRGGRDVVLQHPTRFVRPTSATRRLDVLCQRISNTVFFRSPYLRLVATPGGRAPRDQQALWVGDYFQEAAQRSRKFYTEILHHRVEARGRVRMCPLSRCAVRASVPLQNGPSAHLAFHLLTDARGPAGADGVEPEIPSVSQDEIRERVYEWTRRVLSATHARPVIEHMREVPVPQNLLIIANISDATRGMRASGRGPGGRPSIMRFMVESTTLEHRLVRNATPEQTADALVTLIRGAPALAGFRVEKFVIQRHNLAAADAARSAPCDIGIWRADGTPAFVLADGSSDRAQGGLGPQSLHNMQGMFFGNPFGRPGDVFPANTSFALATHSQRALRWNYFVPNCLNIYVFGPRIIADLASGAEFNGWTPLGNFRGDVTDVGPCVYLSKPGAQARLALAHEMCHALMHAFHAHSPRKQPPPPDPTAPDAPPPIQFTELMGEGLLDETDDHQMSKHISDAPIGAFYDIPEEPRGFSLLNGEIPLDPDNLPATPVTRFLRVGARYGILRANADVPLDPSVTDLPVDQAAAEAQADADNRAAAGA